MQPALLKATLLLVFLPSHQYLYVRTFTGCALSNRILSFIKSTSQKKQKHGRLPENEQQLLQGYRSSCRSPTPTPTPPSHLLFLDLVLERLDRVSRLHVYGYRLSGEGFHEQLHSPSQSDHLTPRRDIRGTDGQRQTGENRIRRGGGRFYRTKRETRATAHGRLITAAVGRQGLSIHHVGGAQEAKKNIGPGLMFLPYLICHQMYHQAMRSPRGNVLRR